MASGGKKLTGTWVQVNKGDDSISRNEPEHDGR